MKVNEILKSKGPHVYSIGEDRTVKEAIDMMHRNHIGSLVILNISGDLTGIISERDILELCFKYPDNFQKLIIKNVMSKQTIIAEPGDDIDYIEMVMTSEFIRHVPIVEYNKLVGLVSIGDIVKAQSKIIQFENKYLRDYINGVRG